MVLLSTINFKIVFQRFYYIILFFVVFIFLDQGISAALKNLYKNIYTGPGRYNYIKENKFDCLIMGSSTSTCFYSDILSDELDLSVLNVGLDGTALTYSRALLDFLISQNVVPQIIILNIDLFELQRNAWSGNFYSRIEQLAPLYGTSEYINNALYKEKHFEFLKYQIASYKFNDMILSLIAKNIREKTFYQRNKAPDGFLKLPIGEDIITKHFSKEIDIDKRKVELYEEFISVCKKNGISCIFVESPKYYPLNKMTDIDKELEKVVENIALRKKIHFIKITQETYPGFKSNSFFKDVLHLNNKGAIIFSNIFCDEMKKNQIVIPRKSSEP